MRIQYIDMTVQTGDPFIVACLTGFNTQRFLTFCKGKHECGESCLLSDKKNIKEEKEVWLIGGGYYILMFKEVKCE